jgi:formylglycine-generating enzyme required for sulfatase activity
MSFHQLAPPALAAHPRAPSPQLAPVDEANPQLSLVDRAEEETCPVGMVLVEGDYCPQAEQRCTKWMESPEKFSYARCAEFDPHPTCQGPREHRRFCIDAREYTPEGEILPAVQISFTAAASLCEQQSKRLCLESEWEFACEGEAMSPYPYGFVRDATACNFEKTELYRPDGSLRDLRDPSGGHPRCTSPFRVSDMVGNIDEWTVRESAGARAPHASALRGGWWMPGRNRCRGATTAHDEVYRGPQTGFRCCAWPR